MTRLLVPPGVPLVAAQRRLRLPTYAGKSLLTDGVDATTSLRARATATASGSAHTKGSWTQVIAATTSDAHVLWLALTVVTNANTVDTSTLLDVGIGAGGSEVVIVQNLAVGCKATTFANLYEIPVSVPGGSRVAIRCQSAVTSKTVACQLTLGTLPHSRLSPAAIDDLGSNTATSRGVTVANPAGANTKGAWTDIVTSTSKPYGALAIGVQDAGSTGITAGDAVVDVGYSNDAGSTYAVLSGGGDLPFRTTVSESWDPYGTYLIPATIPAGSRLAARYARSAATMPLDVILYGVPA